MMDAQCEAYCDGLAEDGYHPLFWASKLDFYLTSMPFYNFPYVFGYLFSNGLSALARREGPAFAKAYARLLEDTGSMTCEELARRHLGEDLAGWGNLGGGVTQMAMPLIFALFATLGFTDAISWRLAVVPGIAMIVAGVLYWCLTKDTVDGNYRELRAARRMAGAKSRPGDRSCWRRVTGGCGHCS